MSNALTIAGSIVAIGGAVAVALALTALGFVLIRDAIVRIETRAEQRMIHWQREKLRTASWWFSEDTPTRELLADLAEMTEWNARDLWRVRRREAQDVPQVTATQSERV
jgi:hypothetical protein